MNELDPVTEVVAKVNRALGTIRSLPADSATFRDEGERDRLAMMLMTARANAEDLRLRYPPDQRAQQATLLRNALPWRRLEELAGGSDDGGGEPA